MKKLLKKSTLLALILVPVLLTGCGTPNYPVLETADASAVTLDTIENSVIRYSYPSKDWFQIGDLPLQIAYTDTWNTGYNVNINVGLASTAKIGRKLTEKDMDSLLSEMVAVGGVDFVTVDVSEMRLYDGEPVIYVEQSTKITDEALDLMIAEGVYTEEMIDAIGGREVVLAMPTASQIAIYAVVDGYCYVCVGSYYEESQKQMLLDAMTIVLSTMERP